jgi:hypothetical protein
MTDQEVIAIVNMYNAKFERLNCTPTKDGTRLDRAYWCCTQIPKLLDDELTHKAHRWLGFVQGVMWCEGLYEIGEMKGHNRSK